MGGSLGAVGGSGAGAVGAGLMGHYSSVYGRQADTMAQAGIMDLSGMKSFGPLSGKYAGPATAAKGPIGMQIDANSSRAEIEAYIAAAAKARGIDPNIALTVAHREGLNDLTIPANGWKSTVPTKTGTEESYGPFQMFTRGGLGNSFEKDTKLDITDPNTVQAQVDYALDYAAENGWKSWNGAKAAGIGQWDGISPDAKAVGYTSSAQASGSATPQAQAASTPSANPAASPSATASNRSQTDIPERAGIPESRPDHRTGGQQAVATGIDVLAGAIPTVGIGLGLFNGVAKARATRALARALSLRGERRHRQSLQRARNG